MEDVEQQIGPMHYMAKMHTILRSPYELVVHPGILDVVDHILGPDILLYNATYIVKEPNTPTHVSWHQDLTYWGLDGDDRRIGLNIQYIAPHVRQTKLPGYSALLVRGGDRFHYYEEETPATRDLDPAALAWRNQQDQLHFSIAGTS